MSRDHIFSPTNTGIRLQGHTAQKVHDSSTPATSYKVAKYIAYHCCSNGNTHNQPKAQMPGMSECSRCHKDRKGWHRQAKLISENE